MEPLIGIVAQELDYRVDNFPKDSYCFISASYVRYVEGAGAKVVPILVLLPGGAISFQEDGYGGAGMEIYKISKEFNDCGDYFPLFGICLGHQLLVHCSAGGQDYRGDVDNLTPQLNSKKTILKPTEDFGCSRMFANAPPDISSTLLEKEVLTFHHRRCVEKHILDDKSMLDTRWKILSYSLDTQDKEFIAVLEAEKYPFYGVQFHPEKNLYELNQKIKVCRCDEAIRVSEYFAEFFVSECRKNHHKFHNDDDKKMALIDNFTPVDSRHYEHSNYNECYFFYNE